MPECFENLPPLDRELLHALRPLEADFPEGLYSAQLLGITEERHDPTSHIPLLDPETRLELIRACIVHISHNLASSPWQNSVQHTIFYDDDRVSEDADASNDGSLGEPNVINDEEFSEHDHSIEHHNAYNPEIIDNSELLEHADASNDDTVSSSDNLNNAELYGNSNGEETSDSGASHDNRTSEHAEVSSERHSKCNGKDDGAVLKGNSDSVYNTDKFSLPYDLGQLGPRYTHVSDNSEDYYSDYTQKPRSKTTRAPSKPLPAPSRVVKSSSRSYSAPSQTVDKKPQRAPSHLVSGGKLYFILAIEMILIDHRLLPRFDSSSSKEACRD